MAGLRDLNETRSVSIVLGLTLVLAREVSPPPSGWGLLIGGVILVVFGGTSIAMALAARDAERTGRAERNVANLFSTYLLGIPLAIVGLVLAGIGLLQLVWR